MTRVQSDSVKLGDEVKVEGDSAKVTLTKEGPGGKDSDTIDLKKVDGKWRVDVEPSW